MFRYPKLHHRPIYIITAQNSIALGRQNLKNTLFDGQNRDIKRSAAQIIYQYPLRLGCIQAIAQTRRSGFIQNSQNIQSRQFPRIASGLSLRIIKIGRHRYHRLIHIRPQRFLRLLLQRFQNNRTQFYRIVKRIVDHHLHQGISFIINDAIT